MRTFITIMRRPMGTEVSAAATMCWVSVCRAAASARIVG